MARKLGKKLIIKIFLGGPKECRNYLQMIFDLLVSQAGFSIYPFYHDSEQLKIMSDVGTQPQTRIDDQEVNPSNCDLMIMLFDKRIGTGFEQGGKKYPSHSAYEIETALARDPRPRIVIARNVSLSYLS